ncbi:MAG: hypothetical protein LQ342_002154 [Letrouitia transgressa]|nr:MAG: hypothetical protein LQ342_002154 [Letrouitia transgressa]
MATSLSNLLPVFVLLLFVLAAAGVGYAVYSVAASVADTTSKKMERKHVVLTKEGMRVGVREVAREGYVDRTQSMLVKAWNYSSWPGYRSRLWNKEQGGAGGQRGEGNGHATKTGGHAKAK